MITLDSGMLMLAQTRSPWAQVKAFAAYLGRLKRNRRLESDFRGSKRRNLTDFASNLVSQRRLTLRLRLFSHVTDIFSSACLFIFASVVRKLSTLHDYIQEDQGTERDSSRIHALVSQGRYFVQYSIALSN